MNISLFERLINNDLEKVTLEYQRRMRPDFSEYIRLIYPDYKDYNLKIILIN